jgi:hypothetical protein
LHKKELKKENGNENPTRREVQDPEKPVQKKREGKSVDATASECGSCVVLLWSLTRKISL